MKKILLSLGLIATMIGLLTMSVHGDMGPKPEISVIADNMPNELCYMDLLTDELSDRLYANLDESSHYNQMMLDKIINNGYEGWHAGIVEGTVAPMFGDIVCEIEKNQCAMTYSYMGVPDRFRIIVVTESGETVISNVVDKQAFQSTVRFDFITGEAVEASKLMSYFFQFMTTFFPTILIELLILGLWGFSIRKNIVPFIVINGTTQLLLTSVIAFFTTLNGTISGLFAYVGFELVVVIAEVILCVRFLKEHSNLRRGVYAVVANMVSFAVGIYILLNS